LNCSSATEKLIKLPSTKVTEDVILDEVNVQNKCKFTNKVCGCFIVNNPRGGKRACLDKKYLDGLK